MPIIKSTYKPTFLFKNSHFNSAYKTLFFNKTVTYTRKRIETTDNDFIDLDFSLVGSETLVIAFHGLEGSSHSKYIVSAIKHLNKSNIDCVAINFRGCSGEDNNNVYSYNSGKTDDVEVVLNYILNNFNYKNIVLLGYSLGGNVTLKFMGETIVPTEIKGAITFSVPCDLKGSSYELAKWINTLYLKIFMKSLKQKAWLKLQKFPDAEISKLKIKNARTFKDFDNAVTAPVFEFKNAEEYWSKCSSKQFIPNIKKPTLLVNAVDDTFLSESCYPKKEASKNPNFYFESPKYGGHAGFNSTNFGEDLLWSENRIVGFIEDIIL